MANVSQWLPENFTRIGTYIPTNIHNPHIHKEKWLISLTQVTKELWRVSPLHCLPESQTIPLDELITISGRGTDCQGLKWFSWWKLLNQYNKKVLTDNNGYSKVNQKELCDKNQLSNLRTDCLYSFTFQNYDQIHILWRNN